MPSLRHSLPAKPFRRPTSGLGVVQGRPVAREWGHLPLSPTATCPRGIWAISTPRSGSQRLRWDGGGGNPVRTGPLGEPPCPRPVAFPSVSPDTCSSLSLHDTSLRCDACSLSAELGLSRVKLPFANVKDGPIPGTPHSGACRGMVRVGTRVPAARAAQERHV